MLKLGVDIGGTKINIGVVNQSNELLHNAVYKVCEVTNVPQLIQSYLSEYCKSTNTPKSRFAGCGIGVPGTVDATGQKLLKAPNISIIGQDLAQQVQHLLQLPCRLMQDSRAAALAEYSAAEKPYKAFVCITLGTGIGTGIVLNGKVFNGGLGSAGELGHIPVPGKSRKCGCGKTGCLEAYAAGKGLDQTAKELLGEGHTAADLFAAAEKGEERCLASIEQAVELLANGITALINVLSPECIVFSGGLSRQTKLYLNPLIEKINRKCYSIQQKPLLTLAKFGANAPMLGAAMQPMAPCRKNYISASVMCADLLNFERDIDALTAAGVDYLHCDVMDNHFVPNLMLPPAFINELQKRKAVPLDIHLMVQNPETVIAALAVRPGDIISFHLESTPHPQQAIELIKQKGCKAAIAINPGTPVEALSELLPLVDVLLIMTVNPGFAGQKIAENAFQKIRHAKSYLAQIGCERVLIEVDGNCSFENAPKMAQAGADILVAGTSSVFSPKLSISGGMQKLREALKAEPTGL